MSIGKVNGHNYPIRRGENASPADDASARTSSDEASAAPTSYEDKVDLSGKQSDNDAVIERLRPRLREAGPSTDEISKIKERVQEGHYTTPDAAHRIAASIVNDMA